MDIVLTRTNRPDTREIGDKGRTAILVDRWQRMLARLLPYFQPTFQPTERFHLVDFGVFYGGPVPSKSLIILDKYVLGNRCSIQLSYRATI
jgi:hypothetical protein